MKMNKTSNDLRTSHESGREMTEFALRIAHPDRGINMEVARFEALVPGQCYRCIVPPLLCLGRESLLQAYPLHCEEELRFHMLLQLVDKSFVTHGLDTAGAHVYFAPASVGTTVWLVVGPGTACSEEASIKALLL